MSYPQWFTHTQVQVAPHNTLIGPDKISPLYEANWLPVSGRPFNFMLRIFGVVPKSAVAKDEYVPPPIRGGE